MQRIFKSQLEIFMRWKNDLQNFNFSCVEVEIIEIYVLNLQLTEKETVESQILYLLPFDSGMRLKDIWLLFQADLLNM